MFPNNTLVIAADDVVIFNDVGVVVYVCIDIVNYTFVSLLL